MFFVSNLRSSSQAGRRGFEPRLPLHLPFHELDTVDAFPMAELAFFSACYLSEGELQRLPYPGTWRGRQTPFLARFQRTPSLSFAFIWQANPSIMLFRSLVMEPAINRLEATRE